MGAEEQLIALAPGGVRNIKQTMLTRLWTVDRYIELIGNFLWEARPSNQGIFSPCLTERLSNRADRWTE
jgi:hypothetical protein